MQSFTHIIQDPEGFHARLAGIFVKEAKNIRVILQLPKRTERQTVKRCSA